MAEQSVGSALVASWKKDLAETKCCGLIVLPGVFTRLYLARKIDEAVERAVKRARRDERWKLAAFVEAEVENYLPKASLTGVRRGAPMLANMIRAKEAASHG